MCRQSATVCLVKSPTPQHRATGPLAERLATLADPRCRRGKRHPFVAVLLIACSAVACGARSFVAIDEWAADAPQDVLARLGARTATALAVRIPPSGATIRRVIKDTCPGGLADLLGHDPAGTDTLALDGKSARGSRLGATPAAHLLAAMTGTGMTVTQLRVPEKTNEVRHEALCRIPRIVRRNSEGHSWVRWLTWIRKVKGTGACHEYWRPRPDARGGASGDPRDTAKAVLPEPQFPVMQVFIHRKRRLKPVPCSASGYFVTGVPSGARAMPSEGIQGDEWGA